MIESCKNCKHFRVGEVEPSTMQKQTTCTRYPPITHPMLTQQGVMMMTVYPLVSEENYCGEFKLALKAVN